MQTGQQDLLSILTPYQEKIENALIEIIPTLGVKSELRDACQYALLNGGRRFRPSLVYMMADSLNSQEDVSFAALAIEFFHTASLVADDLPCMDDDDARRNRPALHKIYGETTALLVSYALISAGYECLAKNGRLLKKNLGNEADHRCVLALENISHNTGLNGATGGQFLDMFPPDLSHKTLKDLFQKKTAALFEVALVLGWLYGGGPLNQLDQVKKIAYHFGMAFQIADDLGDMEQDRANGRKVNIALALGPEVAKKMFHEELSDLIKALEALNLKNSPIASLLDLLIKT